MHVRADRCLIIMSTYLTGGKVTGNNRVKPGYRIVIILG